MKIKVSKLRSIIREALEEAEAAPETVPWPEIPDASLDSEIDTFLVAAESGDSALGESLLREADPEAGAEDDGETPSAPEPGNSAPKVDTAAFARDVAHLVENFDNLIDVKGVVLRRAINYVGKKYGKEQADLVKDVLESQYGLFYDSDSDEPPTAPAADRAGPAMAG